MITDQNEIAGAMVLLSLIRWAMIIFILTVGEPDLIDGLYNLLSSFK